MDRRAVERVLKHSHCAYCPLYCVCWKYFMCLIFYSLASTKFFTTTISMTAIHYISLWTIVHCWISYNADLCDIAVIVLAHFARVHVIPLLPGAWRHQCWHGPPEQVGLSSTKTPLSLLRPCWRSWGQFRLSKTAQWSNFLSLHFVHCM